MAKGTGHVRSGGLSIREIARENISKIIADIKEQGFSKESPFKIGGVEKRMTDFAKENNIEISSNDVYMTPEKIMHSLRDSKQRANIAVSEQDLKDFPINRFKMNLYYDKLENNFIYVDGINKFVINPNYKLKLPSGKAVVVNYITATKMRNNEEFNMDKYIEVKKKR